MIARQLRNLEIPRHPHSIDWLGAILVLAAAVPLMIGLSRVEQAGGWLNGQVALPILIGLAATAALIVVELRTAEPMLPMRLFANKIFTVGNIAMFVPSMVMTALIIIMPLYYQIVLKWSAEAAGLRLIAFTGGLAIGGFFVGSAVSRLGRARIFPLIGGLMAVALCLLVAHEGLGRSTLFDVVCTGLLGASIGFQLNPLNVMVQNGLEIRDLGSGIGGMTFFRSLGGAFGVAAFTTFLVGRLSAGAMLVPGHEKLGPDPGIGLLRQNTLSAFGPEQWQAFHAVLEHAFALVFVLSAGVSLVAFFAVLTIRERPLRTGSGQL